MSPMRLALACAASLALLAATPAGGPFDEQGHEEGGGVLIVLNKSGNDATFVDVSDGEVVRTLPTGTGPHECAVSADGKLAVVANYGGSFPGDSLTVYDLEQGEPAGRIRLGEYKRPHGLAFLGDTHRLLVTAEVAQALIEVDVDAGEVLRAVRTKQDASHMVAVTPDGKRAFVANIGSGTVSAVDLVEWKLIENVTTGAGCEGVAVRPGGKEVWTTNRAADTVSVIDVATLEVAATIECAGYPIRIAFTPDGARALVSNPSNGDLAVIDAARREIVGRVPMKFELAEGAEEGLFGNVFGESPTPIGILVHPGGERAYVANANADRVAVVDLAALAVVDSFQTGREPDGLAFYTR